MRGQERLSQEVVLVGDDGAANWTVGARFTEGRRQLISSGVVATLMDLLVALFGKPPIHQLPPLPNQSPLHALDLVANLVLQLPLQSLDLRGQIAQVFLLPTSALSRALPIPGEALLTLLGHHLGIDLLLVGFGNLVNSLREVSERGGVRRCAWDGGRVDLVVDRSICARDGF